MKYAYTYKQEGMERPKYIYTEEEVAKHAIENQHGVASMDMSIQDKNGMIYEAGYDGMYFLNELP